MATGKLFHNDRVADFGGNDGYASNEFYKALAIKPTVVDCEPRRLDHAAKAYNLPTVLAFLEDMNMLKNKCFDWGYCSHVMEHMRDPEGALQEMARVIKRGCLFILPIEDEEHASMNSAHAIQANSMKEWKELIGENGWHVASWRKPLRQECFIVAEPECE